MARIHDRKRYKDEYRSIESVDMVRMKGVFGLQIRHDPDQEEEVASKTEELDLEVDNQVFTTKGNLITTIHLPE